MGEAASEPMIVYDIETLSVYDNSVILSIAAVVFEYGKEYTFKDLVSNGFFAKLNVKEQLGMGRHVRKDTVDWWKKASPHAIALSLTPKPDDLSAEDAIKAFEDWCASVGVDLSRHTTWVRGSLDFSATQHLCEESLKRPSVIPYNMIRDVRTAIDLLTGSTNGYCKVSKPTTGCIKHDPVHDCALDAMMLMYGERVEE